MVSEPKKFEYDKGSNRDTHFSQPNSSFNTVFFITILQPTLGLLPRQRGLLVTGTQPNLIINHGLKGLQTGVGAMSPMNPLQSSGITTEQLLDLN